MFALLVAGALSSIALAASARAFSRAAAASKLRQADQDDELELRLAERERALVVGLGSRNVRALGRAALFGGTGCAVWELTGGSTHYLLAGSSFGVGLLGWAGCGEIQRRIGSLAGVKGSFSKRRR